MRYTHLSALTAGVAMLLFGFGLVPAYGAESMETRAMSYAPSSHEIALYTEMRKLWADHVFWTRAYIVAAIDDRPETPQAAERLLRNQEDIGDALANYYGQAAGDELTRLLTEHITIAVEIVDAAKADDADALADASDRWEHNAEAIGRFLSDANPYLPEDVIAEALSAHLATTLEEANAHLEGDYEADVVAFDAVFDHINAMSDTLSAAIVQQFPDKFR